MFVRTEWDGPTGENTHGDIFAVKFGKRMVRVDVVYDPIGAIKRELPRTVSGLVARLSSDKIYVRRCAAEALVQLGPEAASAMPASLDVYGNRDEGLDDKVLEMAKTAGSAVVPHLEAGLTNSNSKIRGKSAEVLGEIGAGALPAVTKLEIALHDPDPNVAILTALALRKIDQRDHGEVAVLVELLDQRNVRGAVIWALGDFGEAAAPAVQPLTGLLNGDSENAGLAARTLGLIGKPARAAVPQLIKLLDSENELNVQFAAEALGQLGEDARAAIPKLVTVAEGRRGSTAALTALGSMGKAAIPSLIELYRDAHGRFFVAKALMKQGTNAAPAVPLLREHLKSEKPRDVIVAAMTLGKIGDPARTAVGDLLRILETSPDSHVRVRVAEALWRLDRQTNVVAPIMIAELANWSRQPNAISSRTVESYGQSIHEVAAEVLGEIGPAARQAIPYLKRMRQSSFEERRHIAETGLKSIGDDLQPN